jgi:hypothetical protein
VAVKVKIVVALLVAFTVSAEAAHADTFYGGVAVSHGVQNGPAIGLTVKTGGSIAGRVRLTYGCGKKVTIYNVVVPLRGRANGTSFSASGKTRERGAGVIRYTLTGTLAPDSATGRIKLRNRCGNRARDFTLRAAPAPAGAPALPAPSSSFFGISSQTAAGTPLPIYLRVAKNGRVYVNSYAVAGCGRFKLNAADTTPTRKLRADGTFVSNQRYTVRYKDGSVERYRVNVTGRFLTDGVTGTLRIRFTYRDGRAHGACDTGAVSWAARV